MRYEVHFGGYTHWCKGATPLQAGLLTLEACIDAWHTFPRVPFHLIDLDTGEETTVGLAEVLNILQLSGDYDPNIPEPPVPANCDILRAAKEPV